MNDHFTLDLTKEGLNATLAWIDDFIKSHPGTKVNEAARALRAAVSSHAATRSVDSYLSVLAAALDFEEATGLNTLAPALAR